MKQKKEDICFAAKLITLHSLDLGNHLGNNMYLLLHTVFLHCSLEWGCGDNWFYRPAKSHICITRHCKSTHIVLRLNKGLLLQLKENKRRRGLRILGLPSRDKEISKFCPAHPQPEAFIISLRLSLFMFLQNQICIILRFSLAFRSFFPERRQYITLTELVKLTKDKNKNKITERLLCLSFYLYQQHVCLSGTMEVIEGVVRESVLCLFRMHYSDSNTINGHDQASKCSFLKIILLLCVQLQPVHHTDII